MKRIYYGDIHGTFSLLRHVQKLHHDADEIIIVGDMGVGFPGPQDKWLREYSASITDKPIIRFIRGNHDELEACKSFDSGGIQFIPDGTVENGTLYIGGAWSVDKAYRQPGYDWWSSEELNHSQWEEIFSSTPLEDIHTVISHDCPVVVTPYLNASVIRSDNTSAYLQELLGRLPNVKLWIFGHWHKYLNVTIDGVNFVCLPDGARGSYEICQ